MFWFVPTQPPARLRMSRMYASLSQGLPTEAALRNGKRTIVLKRAGEDFGLVRYFLQHGELDTQVKSRLAELCAVAGVRPTPWQETKVGVASRACLAEKHTHSFICLQRFWSVDCR